MENKKENLNDAWEITAKRYVAFIDIMGFKEMVLKKTHDDIYKMMLTIDDAKHFNEAVNWADNSANNVKSTTYSDSIMIYSRDESSDALHSLICTVSGIINDLLTEGIPYKGGLAFGTITLNYEKSIFFGQPLIDAYLLQEELGFYGIIIHGTAEEIIKDNHAFVEEYACPLKNGTSTHLTIYPMHSDYQSSINYSEYHANILNSLKQMRYSTSGHIRRYIDNTEVYLKRILELTKSDS